MAVQMQQMMKGKAAETKFAPLDFKSVRSDGTFEGYAALFDKEDLARDVVLRGAFRDCLRRRSVKDIKLLFQHDPNQPIGIWETISEDHRGLYVKGRLMLDVARAREVLALMLSGALDGLSIGFRTLKGIRDRSTGRRLLKKIDLWEISVVTFPMMPEARISAVHNGGAGAGDRKSSVSDLTEREFERWLTRDAGFTRSQARTVIRSGFKSLTRKLDAAGESGDETRLLRAMRHVCELMNGMETGI